MAGKVDAADVKLRDDIPHWVSATHGTSGRQTRGTPYRDSSTCDNSNSNSNTLDIILGTELQYNKGNLILALIEQKGREGTVGELVYLEWTMNARQLSRLDLQRVCAVVL